jgi:hypothetical protein
MKLAVALALVGCTTTYHTVRNKAAPVTPQEPVVAPVARRLAAPRPAVDLSAVLPDPSERARWPLPGSAHPMLEPHFDIAGALAEPGVAWMDLCGRGIQNRHLAGSGQDRVEYLRAWCSAVNKNADDAVFRLAHLRSSVVLGIPDALPFDISNILADTGDVADAEHLLAKHALDHDVSLLDTLVATYIEVGKLRAAQDIDRLATDADHVPQQNRSCARLARAIVSASPSSRPGALEQLVLVNKSHGQRVTGECVAVQHELACWIDPADHCDDYFNDHNIDTHYRYLVRAYEQWPLSPADRTQWHGIASDAMVAFPLTGSELIFVAATETEVRTSECDDQILGFALDRTRHLREDSQHDHALDPRFDTLIAVIESLRKETHDGCERDLAGMYD